MCLTYSTKFLTQKEKFGRCLIKTPKNTIDEMLTNDLMRLYNVSSYLAYHLSYCSVAIYPTNSKKQLD